MCLILHQREKWQNKPILRPYYIYAGGPCFWKEQLGIEILFWQQTCCSQPLEWLKPVKKYHRSLPACMLYLYGMCNTRSKTTQNKNILYSVKTPPICGKTIRYSYFHLIFFLTAALTNGHWNGPKSETEPKLSSPTYLQKSLYCPNLALCHLVLRI